MATIGLLAGGTLVGVGIAVSPAAATTVCATPCTIFGVTVPGIPDSGPDSPVELGVKFTADVAGSVTGVRFYKSAANSGAHTGTLWDATSMLPLATASFTGETTDGWQSVTFGSPVAITPGTTYIASYHTNAGHYAFTDFGLTAAVHNPPLHAPASGGSGGNGVFVYGAGGAFPDSTFHNANYWVDVLFATPSCGASCYVDASTGNDGNSGLIGAPLKTIQAGVNAVDTGGTVSVAAGTYTEQVDVTKSINLLGVQQLANPCTLSDPRPSGEAVMTEGSGKTPLTISANDVTVAGFTITGNTDPNLVGAGVYIAPGRHGTKFRYNIVRNNIIGLYPANNLSSDPLDINHNLFKNNTNPGPASGNDIYADNFTSGGPILGASIDANCFTNTAYGGTAINLFNTDGANPYSNITISNNTVTNTKLGFQLAATSNSSILGNTFTPSAVDPSSLAVSLCGGVACPYANASVKNTNISITQNQFGCASCTTTLGGVAVQDVGATGISVTRNDLHGLPVGIKNFQATPTVNGTCNWWGALSGPVIGQVVGAVNASSWLTTSNLNGLCAGVPGAPTITAVAAGPSPDPSPTSIVVSFAPGSDGGSPITGYTATCVSLTGGPTGTTTGPGSPLLVGGLAAKGGYQCTVTATNALGTGPPSAPFVVFLGGTGSCSSVPTAPDVLSTAPGNASATVSWAPAAGCVAGYVVTPYLGSTPVPELSKLITGPGTTTVVKGLTNGQSYRFTVSAENGFVAGPASAFSPSIIAGAPATATSVRATKVGKGTLKVTFAAPNNNGSAITSVTATCRSKNGGRTKVSTAKKAPIAVTGLTAGKSYACIVVTVNKRGPGPASKPSKPTTV